MVTEKDLYTGLQFTHGKNGDTIYTLDLNSIQNVTWLGDDKKTIDRINYSINAICANFNENRWFMINKQTIHEIW